MELDLQGLTTTIEETDTSEMDGKYLTFWTDQQLYGIPIANVMQIVGLQQITEMPDFPHYAKGIISLRGSIIPVIDIRLRLGKSEIEYNERTCIIVTNVAGRDTGVIVDEVDAVSDIADDFISQPPHLGDSGERFLTGIGKLENRVILLMDIRKILGSEQLSVPDSFDFS